MSTAIVWIIIVNLAAGGLAFLLVRALYREIILPNFEQWKKRRKNRAKRG